LVSNDFIVKFNKMSCNVFVSNVDIVKSTICGYIFHNIFIMPYLCAVFALSVTGDRSVVFSGSYGFLHQ